MLLFQKRFHSGLVSGGVSLTFRAWEKPRVKVGGRYRVHPIGVVEVDEVQWVQLGDISDDDARLSGFESRAELLEYMTPVLKAPPTDTTRVLKIRLHHGGDGDRVHTALETDLTRETIAELSKRLARLDADSRWTYETLRLIAKLPRVAASTLAKSIGRETLPFKVDVRKLKKLGLTQSFEVGYELSPRGRAFLEAVPRRPRLGAGKRT